MKLKIFSAILLCLFLVGCMGTVKEINRFDLDNYEAGKNFARGRLYTWSYNKGIVDGLGILNKQSFPITLKTEAEARAFIQSAPTLLGFADMDSLAKKTGADALCKEKFEDGIWTGNNKQCWNEEDYNLGFANGTLTRIAFRSSFEIGSTMLKEFAPDIATQLLPILRFLFLS